MNGNDVLVNKLLKEFQECQKVLTAIGDETRQYLICVMLDMNTKGGMRVVDIAEHTNLSRPAISHHMQILKDAGIVKARKEKTLIYYYLDPEDNTLGKLETAMKDIKEILAQCPVHKENTSK